MATASKVAEAAAEAAPLASPLHPVQYSSCRHTHTHTHTHTHAHRASVIQRSVACAFGIHECVECCLCSLTSAGCRTTHRMSKIAATTPINIGQLRYLQTSLSLRALSCSAWSCIMGYLRTDRSRLRLLIRSLWRTGPGQRGRRIGERRSYSFQDPIGPVGYTLEGS